MRHSWFRTVLRRRIFVIVLLFLQLVFIWSVFKHESELTILLANLLKLVSLMAVLHVISKKDKGSNKVAWVFLMLVFPVVGGPLYLLYHFQASTKRFQKSVSEITKWSQKLYMLPGSAMETLIKAETPNLPQIRYLQEYAGFPVYGSTKTQYFSPGEKFLDPFLEQLEKAQKYIFMEYFIVQEGSMWNRILDILKEKAAQGVDVRIIYDDIGCFLTLPKNYASILEQYGIKCQVFNPFRPVLSAVQNNRDHRKITSIDGKVAFTGGLNMADEYINAVPKYGYWKDSVLMVEGKAAWSMTLMFLEMWALCSDIQEALEPFYPWNENRCAIEEDGFVQPYADSPLDDENVGEHVYLQILNGAKQYVYITTPYLIIDDSMVSALCLAAKSGVDVRIITPHVWDKWLIHVTTRSFYRDLIRGGVKIYEYSKGFIHSKTFVSDDRVAAVGSINLDFRSLYLHFECGVCMYGSKAVTEVKEDFLKTLEHCHSITLEECQGNLVRRVFQSFLRTFAPLM